VLEASPAGGPSLEAGGCPVAGLLGRWASDGARLVASGDVVGADVAGADVTGTDVDGTDVEEVDEPGRGVVGVVSGELIAAGTRGGGNSGATAPGLTASPTSTTTR